MEEPFSISDPITETAQSSFGINYLFPYQRLVISNILESGEYFSNLGKKKTTSEQGDEKDPPAKQIVILPTGAGKSLCFMLPALLLAGPTLVIFPLLSLISDQLRRCVDAGIGAAALTGGQNAAERRNIFNGIVKGSIKIVLTNPETALSPQVLPMLAKSCFMHIVFDEVHTVSEWGDTFRPAYLESRRIYAEGGIPVVTAFTATASETVLSRVREVLFPEDAPHVVSANPDRPNISYTVMPSLCKINSLQLLLVQNGDKPQTGKGYSHAELVNRPALVFCSTRRSAERTALQLRLRLKENDIFFYHAGLSREEKAGIEKWFFKSANGILCATTAYGMGIDKPNIRTVIHHDLSPSVEAYLQESGRAGRDMDPAEAILLLSPSDTAAGMKHNARHAALLRFASDSTTCRRESLMRLLGSEPDICFGCDVCRKNVMNTADWEEEIFHLIKHNRRVLSQPSAVRMLHAKHPQLSEDDAGAAVTQMIISGKIRKVKNRLWKGKLTI